MTFMIPEVVQKKYEGHPITKLQNGINLLILKI